MLGVLQRYNNNCYYFVNKYATKISRENRKFCLSLPNYLVILFSLLRLYPVVKIEKFDRKLFGSSSIIGYTERGTSLPLFQITLHVTFHWDKILTNNYTNLGPTLALWRPKC